MKLFGTALIFDCETNGLLRPGKDKQGTPTPPMDKVHCLAWHNVITKESRDFDPTNIEEGVRSLMEADFLIGHNIVGFDLKAIRKVYPWFKLKPTCIVLDTLILAKMVWPVDVLFSLDYKLFLQKKLPAKFMKRYSLESFGYRFGEFKDEYTGGWAEWNPTMQSYLRQDVRANTPLWEKLEYRLGWSDKARADGVYEVPDLAIEIEHGVQDIIADQELVGVGFNMAKATALLADLKNRQDALTAKLTDIFGEWWEARDDKEKGTRVPRAMKKKLTEFPDVTIRRFSEKTGKELKPYVGPPLEYYDPEAPFVRIKRTTFNPSSRKHLGDRLQAVFGWTPALYTEKGQAQVDEGVIKNISSEVISEDVRRDLLDYFVVTKTLGQLSGSKKSWLESVAPDDGRIHGRCDPLATITTRAAHTNPNLGQVPSVEVDDDKRPVLGIEGGFGFECRDLFEAGIEGWEMSGTDMSSLEFILLGHDLQPLDEGVFSERVSDPSRDPHQEHSELTGLSRKNTKNVGYAYIFGGGDMKIGVMVGVTDEEIRDLLKYRGLAGKLNWRKKIEGADYKEPSDREKATIAKGAMVKKKFEDAITGLKFVKDDMTATAKSRGWIKSIAGHKLICRKPHAALNTRLQGGGAAACKLWIIIFHMVMQNGKIGLLNLPTIEKAVADMPREGLKWGVDYIQMLWVHDEMQHGHRKGLGPVIKRVSNAAAQRAGEILKLRGRFRTDTKTGSSWAHTH
jgi:DNA polymerase-1